MTLNPPVEVALEKVELAAEREPSNEPPFTDNPVVVALPTKSLPPNNVSETVRLVVEALVKEMLPRLVVPLTVRLPPK